MDKWILKFVLFLVKHLVKQGVDYDRLKIIAETKILMDRRRVYLNWRQKQQKENSNPLLMTLLLYGLFGLFAATMIAAMNNIVTAMIFIHSYLLFMMTMTMITDFSSVLLDTTDNQVILPRPVNSRTLFVARLVHILVYLLQFTIALALFPIISIFINYGLLTGIASIFTVMLTVALAVFVTYLLYALIMRFSNEQKVKDIVGYFQIFMTIFFAIGFQLMPRLTNFSMLSAEFTVHWYSYLLPPVWMAMALESVYNLQFDASHLTMIACALIMPVLTFWLMIKYLAPSFARKLAALSNDSSNANNKMVVAHQPKSLSEKLSAITCKSSTESAGFEIVWKITGRDKSFKLQFYPSLAYLFVFIFIFVFKSGRDMSTLWHELPSTKMFLFFVYLPMFSISNSRLFVEVNDNFPASWIYQSTPVLFPGEVIAGGLKALLCKFFIPIYLLLFAFAYYVWGISIADDFVFGLFNNVLIFFISSVLSEHYLPFSKQPNTKQQSGRFAQVILQLLIIAALVGLHYLVLRIDWLIYCLIPVTAAACYFLLKNIQALRWIKISF